MAFLVSVMFLPSQIEHPDIVVEARQPVGHGEPFRKALPGERERFSLQQDSSSSRWLRIFFCPFATFINDHPPQSCEYSRTETWMGPACPLSLVLAPTRELCSQIYDEARKLFHRSTFKVSICYGGVDVKPQMKDLSRGCDVLLATPGRLIDFIDRGVCSMEWIVYLTLDEADRYDTFWSRATYM